jgi:hypothetical protein
MQGVFSVSRVGSTGISHQRMNYNAATGEFSFKFTQGKTTKKIEKKCTLSQVKAVFSKVSVAHS